jgi:hypothetical protein
MEKNQEFLSLFDYLGRAAGGELGKAVHAVAKKENQPIEARNVETLKYKGTVLLYTREFLDKYFNKSTTDYNNILQDDELPF